MKEKLMHNLGMKIVSILVAAILWFTVMNAADPIATETFNDIPVTVINDEAITSRGYSYSIDSGDKIKVKVKGRRSQVDKLTASDIVATADLNTAFILNDLYSINITVVCTADNSGEIDATPLTSTLKLTHEKPDTQAFAVKVYPLGDVREGFYCSECSTTTNLVEVSGSSSQIGAIGEVAVKVNIDGRMNSFTDDFELVAYDKSGEPIDSRKVTFNKEKIRVSTVILPTKEVPIIAETEGTPQSSHYLKSFSYAPKTVLVAGTEATLKDLREIRITCDVDGRMDSIEEQLDLSAYLSTNYGSDYLLVDEDLKVAMQATISQKMTKTITFTIDDIEIRDIPENCEAEIKGFWCDHVELTGRDDVIREVTKENLGLYISVDGCTPGSHSLTLHFDDDKGLQITEVKEMVEVRLKSVEDNR